MYVLNVILLIVFNVNKPMYVKFVQIWEITISFLPVGKNASQYVVNSVQNVLLQEFVNLVKQDFQRTLKENV
jgi:hypothetical protein